MLFAIMPVPVLLPSQDSFSGKIIIILPEKQQVISQEAQLEESRCVTSPFWKSCAFCVTLDLFLLTGENFHKQIWNPHAQGKSATATSNRNQPLPLISKIPKNSHEFSKVWKRHCNTDTEKYQLLLKIGGEELGRIFKAEISMGFLGEFLVILQSCLEERDVMETVLILEELSKTNRFDLSVKFLSGKERSAASELIQKLDEVSIEEEFCGQDTVEKEKYSKTLQEMRSKFLLQ